MTKKQLNLKMYFSYSNLVFLIIILCLKKSIYATKCSRADTTSFICKEIEQFNELITELNPADAKIITIQNVIKQNFILNVGSNKEAEALSRQVEKLDLSHAGIVEFNDESGFSTFTALKTLNLTNCRLEAILEKHFPFVSNIEILDASWNQLENLSSEFINRLPLLRFANFSHNALEKLENGTFKESTQLEYLNLDSNELKNITFGYIPNLLYLSINDNNIEKLSHMDYAIMPKLETLYFTANYLHEIQPGIFEYLNKLRFLNLSANNLKILTQNTFLGLNRLNYLDLSSNDLEKLDLQPFQTLIKLQVLDLSENSLKKLEPNIFENLQMLRKLYLQNNDINQIQADTFEGLRNLDTLDLSYNNIEYIDGNMFGSSIFPRLRKLILKANNIKNIDPLAFASMPFLEYLSLGQNELKSLDMRMFAPLRRLEKLHLGNNLLEDIPAEIFESINGVSELLLDNNKLTFLNDMNATFPNLRKVAIEGNPWQCACLEDLQNWLIRKNIEYVRKESPYFKGERPMCLVTTVDICIKDLRLVKKHEIVDKYENDGENVED